MAAYKSSSWHDRISVVSRTSVIHDLPRAETGELSVNDGLVLAAFFFPEAVGELAVKDGPALALFPLARAGPGLEFERVGVLLDGVPPFLLAFLPLGFDSLCGKVRMLVMLNGPRDSDCGPLRLRP